MANKEIHDLNPIGTATSDDLLASQQNTGGNTWVTGKLSLSALGVFLNKVLQYASDLHTTDKTIIGAINELKAGGGGGYTELTSTLTAGSTTITFTDNVLVSSCTLDVYVDDAFFGVVPTALSTDYTNHSITYTFPAQQSAMPVKVRVS